AGDDEGDEFFIIKAIRAIPAASIGYNLSWLISLGMMEQQGGSIFLSFVSMFIIKNTETNSTTMGAWHFSEGHVARLDTMTGHFSEEKVDAGANEIHNGGSPQSCLLVSCAHLNIEIKLNSGAYGENIWILIHIEKHCHMQILKQAQLASSKTLYF
ncbi:hypothetical protein ACJX0J_040394, partial [Zea mays]